MTIPGLQCKLIGYSSETVYGLTWTGRISKSTKKGLDFV